MQETGETRFSIAGERRRNQLELCAFADAFFFMMLPLRLICSVMASLLLKIKPCPRKGQFPSFDLNVKVGVISPHL